MLRAVPLAEPPAPRHRSPWTIPATAALLALAVLAVASSRAIQSERAALLAEVRESGVGQQQIRDFAAGLYRETEPGRMRIEAARLLLNREIDRPGPWDPDETGIRFGRVLDLARQTGTELPSLSRAFSVHASALTQLWTRQADTRYFSSYRDWERPLEHAIELDPADRFPKETLSFAYLEAWRAIAPEKRPQVEAVLREAFQNEGTFKSLIRNWIGIAGSLDAAARLVPDRPWAWRAFVDSAARADDWPAYTRYARRYRTSIAAETDAAIALAESRVAANNVGGATQLLDQMLKDLPVAAGSATHLERILAQRPAGPAGRGAAEAAAAWLDWLEPLALLGRTPLSPEAAARLAFLSAGNLPPEQAAFASLAAGNLSQAELYERRSGALWSERWAPYLTLKARYFLERQDTAAARAALEQAHRDFHPRLAWSVLAQSVGLPPPRTAAGTLRALGPSTVWEETDWFWKEGVARLELLPSRDSSGLALELAKAPANGGAFEIYWDGVAHGPIALPPGGTRRIDLDLTVTPEPHLLQIRPLSKGIPATARVTLR